MITRNSSTLVVVTGIHPATAMGLRASWSRCISSRADVKFAPCKARPNLFAGD